MILTKKFFHSYKKRYHNGSYKYFAISQKRSTQVINILPMVDDVIMGVNNPYKDSDIYYCNPSGYIIWCKCPFTQENSYFLIIKTQSWSFGHFYSKIADFYAKLVNFVYIIIYSNMKKTWLKVFSTSRWPLLKKWQIIFNFGSGWV